MADVDKFSPVAFDPRAYAAQRSATDPTFKLAFESLDDEFSALDVLLRARKEAGLTQAELAQRCGMDQGDISRIERGSTSPTARTLQRVAEALDADLRLVVRSH